MARSRAGASGAAALSHDRRGRERRDEVDGIWAGDAHLLARHAATDLRCRATAACDSAVESTTPRRGGTVPGLEYGRIVYHQHELAVVCAGTDHELSDPDVRVGDAQLLVGRHGYGAGDCVHPRH